MKLSRIILSIAAALAAALGLIWILQGLNILPGSFMTGHIQWAWRGAGLIVVSAILAWWGRSLRGK